jgi:hypothetical protein
MRTTTVLCNDTLSNNTVFQQAMSDERRERMLVEAPFLDLECNNTCPFLTTTMILLRFADVVNRTSNFDQPLLGVSRYI